MDELSVLYSWQATHFGSMTMCRWNAEPRFLDINSEKINIYPYYGHQFCRHSWNCIWNTASLLTATSWGFQKCLWMNYIKVCPFCALFHAFVHMFPFITLPCEKSSSSVRERRGYIGCWVCLFVDRNSKDRVKYCQPASVELTYKLSLHNFVTWAIKISIEKWIGQRMKERSFCCDFKTTIVFPFLLLPPEAEMELRHFAKVYLSVFP